MTAGELCEHHVINTVTGRNLGRADDLVFDPETAAVSGVVLYGKLKWFGLFGREKDTVIGWEKIEKIGTDVVLVCLAQDPPRKGMRWLLNFLGIG